MCNVQEKAVRKQIMVLCNPYSDYTAQRAAQNQLIALCKDVKFEGLFCLWLLSLWLSSLLLLLLLLCCVCMFVCVHHV